MLACVDVNYESHGARAACLLWSAWADSAPARELVAEIEDVAPYEPGAFYRRELPCLLSVLGQAGVPLTTVVIDGYVWLSREGRPGLGAHLFEALGRTKARDRGNLRRADKLRCCPPACARPELLP